MTNSHITQEDLQEFKHELLDDLKNLMSHSVDSNNKKFLKSYQVREMLNISAGTLHNLRVNGTLPYTRVGNIILYDQDDIMTLIEANKINS